MFWDPLADLLSFLRMLAALFIVACAQQGYWDVAFGILVFGWSTDAVDGIVARRFGSLRDRYPNLDIDRLADLVLGFTASLVATVYIAQHSHGFVTIILPSLYYVSIIIQFVAATARRLWPFTNPTRRLVAVNMLVFHGLLQIGATCVWFASMVGRPWMYATAAVLYLVALVHHETLTAWWDGHVHVPRDAWEM